MTNISRVHEHTIHYTKNYVCAMYIENDKIFQVVLLYTGSIFLRDPCGSADLDKWLKSSTYFLQI